jgi:hypothetical protein
MYIYHTSRYVRAHIIINENETSGSEVNLYEIFAVDL